MSDRHQLTIEPAATTRPVRRRRSAAPAGSRHTGFSLIELMIAMVIGLLLVSSMITVFSGTKRSARLNDTMAQLQENGRFALGSIISDVRMAGFQGCVDSLVTARIRASDAPSADYADTALTAARIEADGSWTPTLPMGFTPPQDTGVPVPGTHALSVQFGSPETRQIEPMASVASDVVITGSQPAILTTGDLALISNCQSADIFRVTQAANGVLKHAATGNRGDNRLSAPYGMAANDRARISRFEANIYYVGNTGRTNTDGTPVLALYRQGLPYDRPPVEMVEGVSNLKLRLGFRDSPVSNDINFVAPQDAAAAAGRVESVQIGLLMQSFGEVASDPDTRTYLLAGQAITPASSGNDTATTYASDRRLRQAFGTTISIRNRR